jgi:anti-anti-sigma factor
VNDELAYEIVPSGDRTVIRLRGEIDLANSADLAKAFDEAAGLVPPVVIDVSQLDFIDSAGFAAIHRLAERVPTQVVVPPAARTARAFGVSGLSEVVPVHESMDDVRSEGSTEG